MKPHSTQDQAAVVDPAVLFRNTMEAPAPEEPKVEIPKPVFKVKNRSRAQKLTKLLYGPLGRVWVRKPISNLKAAQGTIEIGIEQNKTRTIKSSGSSFTNAFYEPIRQYVMGGDSLVATRKRFEAVVGPNFREPLCEPWEFAEAAMAQFKEEIEAENARRAVASKRSR